jgi:hypothetical protein
VDERWRRFRASFEAALAEQLDGRPAAFKALWSHRPDVSIFGALAGCCPVGVPSLTPPVPAAHHPGRVGPGRLRPPAPLGGND